jgi:hypothetical protein
MHLEMNASEKGRNQVLAVHPNHPQKPQKDFELLVVGWHFVSTEAGKIQC